jgi:aminopeptidase S
VSSHPRPRGRTLLPRADMSGAVTDGGFESGGFRYWQQCGNVNASITAARAHGGRYTQKSGSSAGEPSGDEGVCQAVTVPAGAKLTFWVYQYSTESDTAYAYQEAQLFDASGTTVKQLYQTAGTTNGWEQRSYDLAAYAGQTLYLYFGVHGDGYTGAYTIQFVDDVALTGDPAP